MADFSGQEIHQWGAAEAGDTSFPAQELRISEEIEATAVVTLPFVDDVLPLSKRTLQLTFDRPLENNASLVDETKYNVIGGDNPNVIAVLRREIDQVVITVDDDLEDNTLYQVVVTA